jgi:prepilin-type N-terminal cleavage/methylation domain-containing protein
MKKTFLKAFTLIELIIVITIITFITTSSVFYFLDFVKNQEIKQRIEVIENNIKQLDSDIKKYKIFDYELLFNT